MTKPKVWKCRFEDCRHEWQSVRSRRNSLTPKRGKTAPVMCPKCKRRNWNEQMSERDRKRLREELRSQKAAARAKARTRP